MVAQHFRWDFIGLSTDQKPTPETSDKVVDGSTFYCSDNSKLYVYCQNDWYERKPLGGGGGGTTYTAGEGIDITEDTISVDTTVIQPLLTAGTNITISDENVISASGGSAVTTLTTDDYNYPTDNPTRISLALLPSGFYNLASNSVKVDLGSSKQNMKDVLFYVSQPDFNDNMYILLYYPRADVSSGTPYIMESYLGSPSSGNIFTAYTKHIVDLAYLNHFGAFAKVDTSAPTTATEGNVGQIFVDSATQKGYLCVGASGGTYTWKEITLS